MIRKLLFTFLLLLLAAPLFADVGYNTHWSTSIQDVAGTQSSSGTVASNANRVLFVAHFLDSTTANDSLGCSWNGADFNSGEVMTEIDERTGAIDFDQVTVYKLLLPTATTANVRCQHSGMNSTTIFAISVYNVDQVSPHTDIDGQTGTGVSISDRTLTTVAGDMVLSVCVMGQTTTSATPSQSETERLDSEFNANGRLAWAGTKIATTTSTTTGCDWTSNSEFAHSAVTINELDAAATPVSGALRGTVVRTGGRGR